MSQGDPVQRTSQSGIAFEPEDYYIEAETSLVDRPLHTLKRGGMFGVFNNHGDFRPADRMPEGLYHADTRFLSRLEFRIGGKPPLLLESGVIDDNSALNVDLTNADIHDPSGRVGLPRDTLFVNRLKFLDDNVYYERIAVQRFDDPPVRAPVELLFDSDFSDLFEVRGETRPSRGTMRTDILSNRAVRFLYRGLDEIERTTTLFFDPPPASLTPRHAGWLLDLGEDRRAIINVKIRCCVGEEDRDEPAPLIASYRKLRSAMRSAAATPGTVTSSNNIFDRVTERSAADIRMLLTKTDQGLYPFAGVPWYSTIFGRDGIITALQLCWAAPDIALGVLKTLAAMQAEDFDAAADAQPGKILHETRGGEMAILGEVPFHRYYGTVDATPLFVMLAGAYFRRSGDLATIEAIWPNIEAALGWIDDHGDSNGDGFVDYARMTDKGLANQGWKDSHDSIFHADGALAEGPIALVEVQGYVFAAKVAASEIAAALGKHDVAKRLAGEAADLQRRFEEAFWIEELGSYALAIDGHGRPCAVLSSNAGHALFTGIASPERAARVAALLVSGRFFNGWGVRTIAEGEARYNPMSYHNGSVWPHDNALIALGMARYGHKGPAARIFTGLFDAASYDPLLRLPELFCGFARRPKRRPTAYPVACSPQAWSAAAPFALLAATTGLEVDHDNSCVRFCRPALPDFVTDLTLPEITLRGTRLRVKLERSRDDVTVAIAHQDGPATVMIVK